MGLPTYSITCRQLTSKAQNKKQEDQKDLLVTQRSILANLLLLCFTSKVFKIAPLSPVKKHFSRYKMIHICISRLDKSNIRCISINNYQTNTHETHMEEVISLLSIMERVKVTTQRLRQGLLCNQRILSSLLQILLYTIHQHNFSLQVYISNTLPKACIYGINKAVSKVEEVETVMLINITMLN